MGPYSGLVRSRANHRAPLHAGPPACSKACWHACAVLVDEKSRVPLWQREGAVCVVAAAEYCWSP